jgi:hypothetical protein
MRDSSIGKKEGTGYDLTIIDKWAVVSIKNDWLNFSYFAILLGVASCSPEI